MDFRLMAILAVAVGSAVFAVYEYYNQERRRLQYQNQHQYYRTGPTSGSDRSTEKQKVPCKSRSQKTERKEENCTICFETLLEGVIISAACEHQFHYKCLVNWMEINKNCPICRENISL